VVLSTKKGREDEGLRDAPPKGMSLRTKLELEVLEERPLKLFNFGLETHDN